MTKQPKLNTGTPGLYNSTLLFSTKPDIELNTAKQSKSKQSKAREASKLLKTPPNSSKLTSE
jgi:hypothetical protein